MVRIVNFLQKSELKQFLFENTYFGQPGQSPLVDDTAKMIEEGQLWNKKKRKWEEPTIHEREQMMGYAIDVTKAAHVNVLQRTMRLGHAMDANTMRWFGTFLFATQTCLPDSNPDTTNEGGFHVKRCRFAKKTDSREKIHTI